jgi:2-polyprenyl-3-methyl-5-hydroxy-6-metoxy-1,4-benzoquinol methylase
MTEEFQLDKGKYSKRDSDVSLHSGACLAEVGDSKVIECKHCGFAHVLPVPDEKVLTELYQKNYFVSENIDYFKQYERDGDWWVLNFSDRYEFFESKLDPAQRTLLDIGSGAGFFLQVGKNRGWKVKGIEPSRSAATYAKEMGLDVENDFFTENVKNLGKFDVVNLTAVLEHVPNPKVFLRNAVSHLKDKGILCLSVPNDFNPFQKILVENCDAEAWWVVPHHHLNYFNHHSLRKLVEDEGLTPLYQTTSFPIDIFLLMGDNYLDDEVLGRASHKRRVNFEKKLNIAGKDDLRRKLYESFAELNIGREVILYAQKQ